jgi:carboxymethylenebutenolidase
MTEDIRQRAIALYDRFTHEGMERRAFMTRMAALAGSVAAAEALIATIAASPAAAAIVPPDDPRLTTNLLGFGGHGNGPMYKMYVARPKAGPRLRPAVLVIHENRGLNEHTRDVARRVALEGHIAIAPDMLSPLGGTPADEDKAREMIGKLDLGAAVTHMVQFLDLQRTNRDSAFSGTGKVGAVGFCWGGAFVNRLAVAAGDKLDAGVVFYGPGPDVAEATRVQAPLMIHLAGLDERVNATGWPWVKALRAADKTVTAFHYEGANHAFHNDTSAERYDAASAALAWRRTMRFFGRHLGG